jgi:histidinol dehydrogenase
VKTIRSWDDGFAAEVAALRERGESDSGGVEEKVREIIADVRGQGDSALVEMAARFDGATLTPGTIRVPAADIAAARRTVDPEVIALIERAAERIRLFHREQMRRSWFVTDETGSLYGQNFSPVESAGLYVPGGKAVYPSTVLMNAIPAQVAGVRRIVICTPATGGEINPLVLATADVLGIGEIYRVGGAQAVAAMAWGTAAVPRVDKIVGPGNIWVATAKKMVYGRVSIDSIAGPSEIFVIADAGADPEWVAADLLSQAEHDEMASSVLLTDCAELAARVEAALAAQVATLARRDIAVKSLASRGRIIIVRDITEAFDLANELGPEHLEVLTADPLRWLARARYAGSVFFGPYTPEAVGDYLAGPNHVLPTGGAARFSSSLGVDDFLVRSNVLAVTERGFLEMADGVARFADLEGLDAHARSVRLRRTGK